MLSKVVTMDEILDKFHDDQTIMFGDWHGEFAADDIIDRLVQKDIKGINAIAVSAGMPDQGVGKLIKAKMVKSLITTHIAYNPIARDQMFAGELEVEFSPRHILRTHSLRRLRSRRLSHANRHRYRCGKGQTETDDQRQRISP